MAELLSDLRKVLTPEEKEVIRTGEVVSVGAGSVMVKTVMGLKEYPTINPGQFKVGDKVRLSGDIAISKVTSTTGLPTFTV